MKKYYCTFLAIILCLIPYSTSFAADNQAETVNIDNESYILADTDEYSVVFVPEYEFTIVSSRLDKADDLQLESVEWSNSTSEIQSTPEQEVGAKFSHKIYDRNGVLMATATVTVIGMYSRVDQWSEMTSVTAEFAGTYKDAFSYSSSTGGNKGYLNIMYYGSTVLSTTYTISNSGSLQRINSYE